MQLLLDTQVFLWWDSGDRLPRPGAFEAIADPAGQVFVSAASVLEIAIKARLGKPGFTGSAVDAMGRNRFFELPIVPAEAEAAGRIDWAHGDPFDRLLVAHARLRGMTLVTADRAIAGAGDTAQMWAGA